jgi:hypothetical protein
MCMQPQWCVSPTASSPLHIACPGFVSYLSCRMLWWYRPLRYSEREGQHTGVFTYQWSSVAPCFPSSSTVCGIGRMPPMTMSWSSVSMSTRLGFLVVAAAPAPAVCAPITIVAASSIMVRGGRWRAAARAHVTTTSFGPKSCCCCMQRTSLSISALNPRSSRNEKF